MLVNHGEAIEADLALRGFDLLDFYAGPMSVRRLWVLVSGLLLIDGSIARPGTALATAIHGPIGDWTRLELLTASVHGIPLPEDRQKVDWKQVQQDRIKRLRAERASRTS